MNNTNGYKQASEMTLREKLAMEAMIAVEQTNTGADGMDFLSAREVANRAVNMADKLIERLNSEKDLEKPKPAEKKTGLFG